MNYHLQGPNIVNEHATRIDIECLFGDIEGNVDQVDIIIADCLDWADVAVHCGFFPSKGQARKNGWEGQVPRGFGQRKFGKHGKCVWYFNPEEE